jgi:hypothetical protein
MNLTIQMVFFMCRKTIKKDLAAAKKTNLEEKETNKRMHYIFSTMKKMNRLS